MPLLVVTACNRENSNQEAIRRGVLDHLAGSSVNLAAMDMDVTSVDSSGDQADVTVLFKPKGASAAQGMSLHYRMQQKDGRWAVVGIEDSGHGGSVQPGAEDPHGGGALPVTNPHGEMPAPEDLPPAK